MAFMARAMPLAVAFCWGARFSGTVYWAKRRPPLSMTRAGSFSRSLMLVI
jgi:hypothetical protein